MNRSRRIAILVVFVLIAVIGTCIGFLPARSESKAESKADTKVEDNFKVSWSSISYAETASLRITRVSDDQEQEVSERLRLSCEVEILDPNFVLGINRAPVIEEAMDGKGANIEIDRRPPGSVEMRYQAPRYRRRFVLPKKPAKWKTIIRSVLRLPPKRRSGPRWVKELEACRMQIDLAVGAGEQSSEKIRRVKGHFHVLVAESFEYVDVPFKKSDKWVRLTPDVEVQVRDAFCDGTSYRLSTKARPEARGFREPLFAGSYLPDRLLVGRRLVGRDGKVVREHARMYLLAYTPSGTSSGNDSEMVRIRKIRYVIAVNPAHYEIPFVLENIPLPKP
ncbi:MAG: hypothetical protein JSW47_01265 [Phycisphaerales bacterium]|nr:MAG: hypothetical protein JSW47_01265 [Phycisphaerales bacterium]UCF17198.1 MAG: hypothetical protein JSW59_07010 [Phycisphaerales bacterium]